MLVAYKADGMLHALSAFRADYTKEMIDSLQPIEDYDYIRIYDPETIDRVWMAMDTGGTVRVKKDEDENVEVITENGDLEPPKDEPPEPEPTETELLQEYLVDVDFRVAMIELDL